MADWCSAPFSHSLVARTARGHFQTILREAAGALPHLDEIVITEDRYLLELRFSAYFGDRDSLNWSVRIHGLIDDGGTYHVGQWSGSDVNRALRDLYSSLYEDELMRRELAPMRLRVQNLVRECARPDAIQQAMYELHVYEEHIRRHHATPPPMIAVDFGRELTEIDLAPGAVNYVREHWAQIRRDEDRRGDAQKRALELLTSWLTPAQREQYGKAKYFDVIGSKSGKRYRIHQGRQMNVHELGADGESVAGWCFLPRGGLVEGDCMLAQKIALETDEPAALKIANKFGVRENMTATEVRARYGQSVMRGDQVLSLTDII